MIIFVVVISNRIHACRENRSIHLTSYKNEFYYYTQMYDWGAIIILLNYPKIDGH